MLKLRRITNGENWIPQVDGLRFVAILSVLLFHVSGEVAKRGLRVMDIAPDAMPLYHWLANGDRGVALFFVLSGYVLARPFYHMHRLNIRRVSLPKYFLRRLTRLEPPYLLCLVIYCVAFHVAFHVPLAAMLPSAGASAVYLHNLIYPNSPGINFVTWSLEIEVQFYILAPLMGMIFLIQKTSARYAILATMTLAGCFVGAWIPGPPVTVLAYAGFFPAGFLLAEILENPERSRKQSWVWDVVGFAGWIALFWLPFDLTIRSFLPLLILPLYLTVFYGKFSSRILGSSFIALTGGMCYSIYLLHMLILSIAFRAVKHITFANDVVTSWVQIPILIVIIIVVSTVFFVMVERPCMNPRWPQQLLARIRSERLEKSATS